jgi:hypothetical protein
MKMIFLLMLTILTGCVGTGGWARRQVAYECQENVCRAQVIAAREDESLSDAERNRRIRDWSDRARTMRQNAATAQKYVRRGRDGGSEIIANNQLHPGAPCGHLCYMNVPMDRSIPVPVVDEN